MSEETFLARYQSLEPQLRAVAHQVLGYNSPDVEDALQNAFLKAWLKQNTVRSEASFAKWLWRIVKNESISLVRQRIRSREYLTDDFSMFCEKSPFEEELMGQMAALSLVGDLCFPYNDAVVLYYIHGYKIREISAILQRPEGTVKGLLYRARKMMQGS